MNDMLLTDWWMCTNQNIDDCLFHMQAYTSFQLSGDTQHIAILIRIRKCDANAISIPAQKWPRHVGLSRTSVNNPLIFNFLTDRMPLEIRGICYTFYYSNFKLHLAQRRPLVALIVGHRPRHVKILALKVRQYQNICDRTHLWISNMSESEILRKEGFILDKSCHFGIFTRPKKINCLFPVTVRKKIGQVGR